MSKKSSKKLNNNIENLTDNDSKLLEESFNLIKNLNSQVEIAEKQKEKLSKDVELLSKKIDLTEKKQVPNFENTFLQKIKEEIISEFMPLIKKLNLKSLNIDLNQEINKVLELELNKLRSEISYSQSKDNNELSKRITQIEVKLIDTLRENKKLKEEFDSKSKNLLDEFLIKLEDKISNNFIDFQQKTINLEKVFSEKNISLEEKIKKYDVETKKIQSELQKLSVDVNSNFKTSNVDLSLIESKIKNFEVALVEVKQLLSRYEDDLYKKDLNQTKEIKELYQKRFKQFESDLKIIKKEREAQLDFLTDKFNEIIEKFNNLDLSSENKIKDNFEKIKEYISTQEKSFFKIIDDMKVAFSIDLKEKNLNLVKNIDNKILEFQNILEVQLKNNASDISKQILSLNDFKLGLEEKQKKELLDVSEQIEQKLLESQKQVYAKIDSTILDFNKSKTTIQEQFDSDKLSLDKFKTDLNKQLEELNLLKISLKKDFQTIKKDLITEQKSYLTNTVKDIDKKVKIEENSLNKTYEDILNSLEKQHQTTLFDLNTIRKDIENDLRKIIESQKVDFEDNENSFKNIFNEKIQNLKDFTIKSLEKDKSDFVKTITDDLRTSQNEFKKEFDLLAENLSSKADEISKKTKNLETKELNFYEESHSEIEKINTLVNKRMTEMEQKFNNKFLDYDSSFNTFKGVIVDEVEDLIKEVTNLTEEKITIFNTLTTKLNFEKSEIEKKIFQLRDIHKLTQDQIKDLRDKYEDLKVQLDISTTTHFTINEHIAYMREYENQLMGIVSNLQLKNISDKKIYQILIDKGHPSVYVSIIIDRLEKLKNL